MSPVERERLSHQGRGGKEEILRSRERVTFLYPLSPLRERVRVRGLMSRFSVLKTITIGVTNLLDKHRRFELRLLAVLNYEKSSLSQGGGIPHDIKRL